MNPAPWGGRHAFLRAVATLAGLLALSGVLSVVPHPSTSDERAVETRDPEAVPEPPNRPENRPEDQRLVLTSLIRSRSVARLLVSHVLYEAHRGNVRAALRRSAVRSRSRAAVLPRVPASGNCGGWLAAAGVQDTRSAHALINLESHCDPYVYNRGGSGACGVGQALPCGKTGCAMGDGACQVRWMDSYVTERYGSWAAALAFRRARGWY